jgi:CubicO group peptidase (beta-lactamase class C family)
MRKIILPFVLFLSVLSVFGQQKTKSKEAAVEAVCKEALGKLNVPGLAIAVVKDSSVVLSKGFGVREVGKPELVTDESLFAIASNSKAFTSAALAMLVDEGKLKWSDKVRDYLPYFELYSPYVSQEMTVRDLLCHRSGLATFSGDLIWYGTTRSREDVVKSAKYLKPVYGFREAYGYSNIMFVAAGEVIAKVSGLTWDEFIKTRIFDVLGMTRANTSITAFKPGDDIAMPHNEMEDGKNQPIEYVNWDNVGAAGSINACVKDLAKWMQLQLNKGAWDGKQVWSKERSREMWEVNTAKPVSKWQQENMKGRNFSGYGLGWDLMDYRGYKIVSHGGGYDGMISKTVLVPELNLGFVILTNSINSASSCLTYAILDIYLTGKQDKDWVAQFVTFKEEDAKESKEAMKADETARLKDTKPSLPLSAYCGTYVSEMYGEVKVVEEKGRLQIDFIPTALFKGELSHWHLDTFQLTWKTKMMLPKGKVNFIINAEGAVEELRVDVVNPDFDFSELKLKKKS